MTSAACAAIKTETTAIMTTIKRKDGRDVCLALVNCATRTTAAITSAWTVMLQTLAPAPTRNWRNILLWDRFLQICQTRFFITSALTHHLRTPSAGAYPDRSEREGRYHHQSLANLPNLVRASRPRARGRTDTEIE